MISRVVTRHETTNTFSHGLFVFYLPSFFLYNFQFIFFSLSELFQWTSFFFTKTMTAPIILSSFLFLLFSVSVSALNVGVQLTHPTVSLVRSFFFFLVLRFDMNQKIVTDHENRDKTS